MKTLWRLTNRIYSICHYRPIDREDCLEKAKLLEFFTVMHCEFGTTLMGPHFQTISLNIMHSIYPTWYIAGFELGSNFYLSLK